MSNEPKSVREYDPSWSPEFEADGSQKKVASKDDYIDGYYIGCREGQGKDGKPRLYHTIRKKDGSNWTRRGVKIVDELIAKNVTVGEYIRIQYLGLGKTKAGNDCYQWDVLKFENEPMLEGTIKQNSAHDTQPATAGVVDGLPDDLPF